MYVCYVHDLPHIMRCQNKTQRRRRWWRQQQKLDCNKPILDYFHVLFVFDVVQKKVAPCSSCTIRSVNRMEWPAQRKRSYSLEMSLYNFVRRWKGLKLARFFNDSEQRANAEKEQHINCCQVFSAQTRDRKVSSLLLLIYVWTSCCASTIEYFKKINIYISLNSHTFLLRWLTHKCLHFRRM